MKYYSEVTHKYYDTYEECYDAEEKVNAKNAEKKEKENNALSELDELYECYTDAKHELEMVMQDKRDKQTAYMKKLNEFMRTFGYCPEKYSKENPLTMFWF